MAAPSGIRLPSLRHADPALQAWADDLVRVLEDELARLRTPAGQTAYALQNVAVSRTLDPTTATAAQIGQVVATVIQDLQKKGQLAQ